MADFKKPTGPPGGRPPSNPDDDLVLNPSADEFFKRLQSDMRRPQPSQEAIAAALQTMQRLAAESVADAGIDALESGGNPTLTPTICDACGYRNRSGNRFCGTCGLPLEAKVEAQVQDQPQQPTTDAAGSTVQGHGPHHYHHHYHHHYFTQGHDLPLNVAGAPRTGATDSAPRDSARLRSPGASPGISRAEAAVRKVTQDWALACNSRQLDDLVSTYSTDAMVMRPNHPVVRGTGSIREFFFSALDAGLGEVELDVLRVDLVGDVAYEAGRCKMLVPTAVGKRREERGKYLMILARQTNGEWRIVADCWSSDLSLTPSSEADVSKSGAPSNIPQKPPIPRKGP
jgi:ketosteroid isomerase-like protein